MPSTMSTYKQLCPHFWLIRRQELLDEVCNDFDLLFIYHPTPITAGAIGFARTLSLPILVGQISKQVDADNHGKKKKTVLCENGS